jgi:subtilase-type serine protease
MSEMINRPARRQRVLLWASLSSFAILAGCGGEDGSSLGNFFTITASPGGSGTLGSFYMASLTQNWRDAAASFRNNSPRYRLQDGTFNNGQVFANPLQSSRVDYAHALGLTGQGQVIAIVDEGFRQTHEAFAGKSNTSTGSPGVQDHGTMVASIAAGDSPSMVGVAPGADLIFSEWGNSAFSNLTLAADAARTRRAVAQNNSWGFTSNSGTTNLPINSTSFNSIFVNNPDGAAWLTALDRYVTGFGSGAGRWDGGVVIFAIDNDNYGTSGLMDALPVQRPDFEVGWLAVGNAIPIFDDNGVNGVARPESSPCYEAARWCLMADGYWTAASGASNASYQSRTGSSFAAPQVAGALALLAEAFPSLTPHQLRARILASADNTFTGFMVASTVDLDEGIGVFNHDYSTDYGHGFLDIRAALLPIGPTGITLADGGTIATKDFSFSTGGAMGDAVTRSLDGIDLAVTDALGGGFDVAAKSFAAEADPGGLAVTLAARSFGKDYKASRTASLNPLADTFAAQPGQTLELSDPEGQTKAAVLISNSENFGIAVSRTLTEGDLKVDLGLKVARDSGSVMGFSDASGAGGATMTSVTLGLSQDVGEGGFFALSGEVGIADLARPTAISSVSSAAFNSVSLDIGSRGVFSGGDRLALGVSMPISVTSGSANMTVPVARGDGSAQLRSVDIDLAPEERQMELSISYQVPMSDTSEMLFKVIHAENYGNQAGVTDSAAVIGMTWAF